MIAVILDILIAVLLVGACGFGVVLSRKLGALKAGQTDLAAAINTFDSATRRAEETLQRIEAAGLANGRALSLGAKRAETLANDLSVMIVAGDRVADRIETALGDVRAAARSGGERGRSAA
jgi:hypothetical protein